MFVENLKMAISALISNKMRSFLTMLGIIIGIGSVITISSIGDTVRKMVSSTYENVGSNQSQVFANIKDINGAREDDLFSSEDIEKYKQIFANDLIYIDSNSSSNGEVKNQRGLHKVNLNGVDYNFLNVQNSIQIKHGRFFNQSDIKNRKYLAVIEDKAAISMFGTENAVGKTFRQKFNSNLNEFKVIGVYNKKLSPIEKIFNGKGQNLDIFIPTSLFIESENNSFFSLRIYANNNLKKEQLKNFNDKFLEYIAKSKDRNKEDYFLYSIGSEMQQIDVFLNGISLAIGGIAAISLIVGGIGIMNIMLVSVTERTREIGTRKALGATTKDILTQFLIESAVLSLVGGIIGILIAAFTMSIIGILLKQAVVIRPTIILFSVAFSALVGVFFGIYPANKAAKRDPIVALRYE